MKIHYSQVMKVCMSCLLLIVGCTGMQLHAQELKPKEVKKMMKAGQLTAIAVVCGDEFVPNEGILIDVKVSFSSGAELLASQFDFLWDDVTLTIDSAVWDLKHVKLSEGKIVYNPGDASRYYPAKSIRVSAVLSGKKSEKTMKPIFCNPNFAVRKVGGHGINGKKGPDGKRGQPVQRGGTGGNGENGPDFKVRVEEETIDGKLFIILIIGEEKYPVDPSCRVIKVISQGGDGGEGGTGGDGVAGVGIGSQSTGGKGEMGGLGGRGGKGGNGGTITVSGSAYDKYADRISFLSLGGVGGKGGKGGVGGFGPNGSGPKGENGIDGPDGIGREVIVGN